MDDVEGIDADVVEVSDMIMAPTAAIGTDSVDQQLALFSADEGTYLVPSGAAANRRQVSTRGSMFIPAPLLPLVLGHNLTARETLFVLVPAIRSLGLEEACEPLLDFLLVATAAVALDDDEDEDLAQPETVQAVVGTTPPLMSAVLRARRREVMYRDLPVLEPTTHTARNPALGGNQGHEEQPNPGPCGSQNRARREGGSQDHSSKVERKDGRPTLQDVLRR